MSDSLQAATSLVAGALDAAAQVAGIVSAILAIPALVVAVLAWRRPRTPTGPATTRQQDGRSAVVALKVVGVVGGLVAGIIILGQVSGWADNWQKEPDALRSPRPSINRSPQVTASLSNYEHLYRNAKVGVCVAKDADEEWRIADCAPAAYRITRRVENPSTKWSDSCPGDRVVGHSIGMSVTSSEKSYAICLAYISGSPSPAR